MKKQVTNDLTINELPNHISLFIKYRLIPLFRKKYYTMTSRFGGGVHKPRYQLVSDDVRQSSKFWFQETCQSQFSITFKAHTHTFLNTLTYEGN